MFISIKVWKHTRVSLTCPTAAGPLAKHFGLFSQVAPLVSTVHVAHVQAAPDNRRSCYGREQHSGLQGADEPHQKRRQR